MYVRWSRIEGSPEAYARRALAHAAISRWRLRRRRPEVLLCGLDRADAAPGDELAAVDLRDVLVRALLTLPPRQRAVLVLRYFDDLPEAEVAEALGCSLGTVKSQASRALARLRENAAHLDPRWGSGTAVDSDSPVTEGNR